MAEDGFPIELTERFELLMKSDDWRSKTIDQLVKDMYMSGVSSDDRLSIENHDDPIPYIVSIIQEVKGNKPLWDNLNYRIDLPSVLNLDTFEDEELAQLYLVRAFQKVWLRKQFSDGVPKDGSDSTQKHLKP